MDKALQTIKLSFARFKYKVSHIYLMLPFGLCQHIFFSISCRPRLHEIKCFHFRYNWTWYRL